MNNNTKNGAIARMGRRIATVTVIAAASLAIVAGSAQAMPKEGVWYRCYVDGVAMWCMDL